jgi:hypothetical protein
MTPYTNDETSECGCAITAVPHGHEALNSGRWLPALDWWNEGVLGGVGAVGTLTRLQVIRVMRDQDGGAHLDDHIRDEIYLAVHLKGVGFQYKHRADSEETMPVEGSLEATVRQMAYEVLQALQSSALSAQIALRQASKKGPLSSQYFETAPDT